MVYARRSTYRRKGRRGHRTLSAGRVFGNKSAKAQAKQIFALSKRIKSVQRQCRPEVKLVRTTTANRGLALSSTATPGTTPYSSVSIPLPSATTGTTDSLRIGNKVRLMNPKVYLGLQYREVINSAAGYYNSTLNNRGIQVRLIAVQAKVPHSTVPQLTDILQNVNFDSQINSMMMMREPFQIGITSRFHILMDRRMTVNADNPTKSYRFSIKPRTRSAVWEDGQTYPKGAIYLFMLGGGFSYKMFESGELELYDSNLTDVTFRMSTPFTDA